MIALIERLVAARLRLRGRRRRLLRGAPVPRLRQAVGQESRRAAGRRARRGRRAQARSARLRAVEAAQAGRAVVGRARGAPAVRAGTSSARPCRCSYLGEIVRHPRRRRGPDLPAPRVRDRPVRGGHAARRSRATGCTTAWSTWAREKMSKSLGNTLTIRDLVTRHDPAALRLFLLGTHYRSPARVGGGAAWRTARARSSACGARSTTRAKHAGPTAAGREGRAAAGRSRGRSGSGSSTRWTTTSTRREALGALLHRPEPRRCAPAARRASSARSCAGRPGARRRSAGALGPAAGPVGAGVDEAPQSIALDRASATGGAARSGTSSGPTRSVPRSSELGAILEDKPGRHRVEVEGRGERGPRLGT